MLQLHTPDSLRQWRQSQPGTLAMVPTMGALHAGHMALVRHARELADNVLVSVFVNPKQFGPNEDYASYPRLLEQDAQLCAEHGVSALYAPTAEAMYPPGYSTNIQLSGVTQHLDGLARPGHFDGVATVVTKLLLQAMPTVALFGEKDYQQLQVIKQLVADLNLPVAIEPVPTEREPDGLARSSRNAYLTPQERTIAPALYQALITARARMQSGEPVAQVQDDLTKALIGQGFSSVDYLSLHHPATLEPLPQYQPKSRLLAAARLGRTRLIDNIEA